MTALAAAAVVVLTLLAAPLSAEAQQTGKVYRIGVLWPGASPPLGSRMDWFREGLRESGYVEGQNVAIELRYAERGERLYELAAELVQLNVSLIAAFWGSGTADSSTGDDNDSHRRAD